MSDNLTDAFNNLKKMVDSGNIPNELQGLVNSINKQNGNSNQNLSDMLSKVSPEMINNISSMLQSNNNSSNSSNASNYNSNNATSNYEANYNNSSNNNFNLDAETIMKMSSIISAMNQKDNASSNLLNSLKPYLRDSRKAKVDQYANLLNITKLAEVMKNDKKENHNNA